MISMTKASRIRQGKIASFAPNSLILIEITFDGVGEPWVDKPGARLKLTPTREASERDGKADLMFSPMCNPCGLGKAHFRPLGQGSESSYLVYYKQVKWAPVMPLEERCGQISEKHFPFPHRFPSGPIDASATMADSYSRPGFWTAA